MIRTVASSILAAAGSSMVTSDGRTGIPLDVTAQQRDRISGRWSDGPPLTAESRRLLTEAAKRYRERQRCGFPGCDRQPIESQGGRGGRPAGYCDLPEHTAQSAYNERRRLGMPADSDPNRDARAARDRVIREVYRMERERADVDADSGSYGEIGALVGLAPQRVAQIVTPVPQGAS